MIAVLTGKIRLYVFLREGGEKRAQGKERKRQEKGKRKLGCN